MAMILQSGFNQNNNRGRGRNGNQRGRGRGFNNSSPNFGFNNSQSFGSANVPQFLGFQPQSQHKGGYGFPSFQFHNQYHNTRPTCQICGKNGHIALDCYHCMNFAYQGRHAPAKLASMVASSMVATANSALANASSWLTDIGCSVHVTLDLSQLSLIS